MIENLDYSSELNSEVRFEIRRNVLLADYTTFKIGGPADYFASPENIDEFENYIRWALNKNIPFFVLGKGANILVNDSGYRGLIIYTARLNRVRINGDNVEAECGVTVDELVEYAAERGLSGLEFLSGMPGSVGGAVFMNARAYGGEIAEVIDKAEVLKIEEKNRVHRENLIKDKMKFSYKYSIFQRDKIFIYKVFFKMKKWNKRDIINRIKEIKKKRMDKGEYLFPSAGCVFKNDYSVGISSGKIIERCGLKGVRIGDAEVYERHANFIINRGNARANDVYNLIKLIEKEVKDKTGIKLEREIILLGFEN